MERDNKGIYIVSIILTLFVLGGFLLVFDTIGSIRGDVKNLESSMDLLVRWKSENEKVVTQPTAPTTPEIGGVKNPPQEPETNTVPDITIPSAIIFETKSSMALLPQINITVTVEGVAKTSDGTIIVNFKAFTSQATGYSALEPRDFFELVSLEGENQKVIKMDGQFSSIPPKSASSGAVYFKVGPTQNTIILQIGAGENLKFYEFNFLKKTYKETVIGLAPLENTSVSLARNNAFL